VRVVAYSARWPDLYAAESERLTRCITERGLKIRLEHTGSTAVHGLSAKPIIDILAGLGTESSRGDAIDAFVAAGYLYRGEQGIPGRDFFRRGDPRQYHVHLTTVDSPFWSDHVTFRDWLRNHPGAAAEYARLKAELAERFPTDREAYIAGKTAFVDGTLRDARSHAVKPSER
jgi:GrpB-like predicted nucleotidyltransferase (UPF0157 family)